MHGITLCVKIGKVKSDLNRIYCRNTIYIVRQAMLPLRSLKITYTKFITIWAKCEIQEQLHLEWLSLMHSKCTYFRHLLLSIKWFQLISTRIETSKTCNNKWVGFVSEGTWKISKFKYQIKRISLIDWMILSNFGRLDKTMQTLLPCKGSPNRSPYLLHFLEFALLALSRYFITDFEELSLQSQYF